MPLYSAGSIASYSWRSESMPKYSFSRKYFKNIPSAADFGKSWEILCLRLLQKEYKDNTIRQLGPPDHGVDLLHPRTFTAYQCKSSELGCVGTIDPNSCIKSFQSALDAQSGLRWKKLKFAFNGNLSGTGQIRINDFAREQGTDDPEILGPEYWSDLCERHPTIAKECLDYREFIDLSEDEYRSNEAWAKFGPRLAQCVTPRQIITVKLTNEQTDQRVDINCCSDFTLFDVISIARLFYKFDSGESLRPFLQSDLGGSVTPRPVIKAANNVQALTNRLCELSAAELDSLKLCFLKDWKFDSKRSSQEQRLLDPQYQELLRKAEDEVDLRLQKQMWQSRANG